MDLVTGVDSPVKIASSVMRLTTFRRRASAATLSPVCKISTSPGTTSRAGISFSLSVPADNCLGRRHFLQRRRRLFGPVLLEEAQQDAGQNNGQDYPGVQFFTQEKGNAGGNDQDYHEQVGELAQEYQERRNFFALA